ncbi:MAG TPA: tRNA (adenosine(37)-N6)-threonylcarbamoyltransferase complex ATPase subunit type 1 TsaE [Nitrospira sp.]
MISSSPLQTDRLGRSIGKALQGGETLALLGPLGAGKTSLVRGIAVGLGAPPTAVSSPTFVFIHEYHGRLPFAHVDLYRVRSIREVESTGLEEYLSGETVIAIEWADKGLSLLPQDRLEIELRHRSVGSRTVRLSSTGPKSAALLTTIMRRYARATQRTAAEKLKRPKHKRNASP